MAKNKIFNQTHKVVEGWYWAIASRDLKKNKVKHLNFLGKELALYRGDDNKVRAVDAYCPHMGAHLAEGKVEGTSIRCFFHHWKFDADGTLVDIPCRKKVGLNIRIKSYPTYEQYGLVWIWPGDEPKSPVPFIHELGQSSLDFKFGKPYLKKCHPNVMMINAIDAHHFTSVHNFPVEVKFETKVVNGHVIKFENRTKIPHSNIMLRFFSKFYKNYLTYNMCYWFGSTGSVTVGPDFLHCHIIFSSRPTKEGHTEGRTILVTKKRKGIVGLLLNPIILWATKQVGNYFAKGDTEIFNTIRFSLNHPIKEDDSILKFFKHVERMETIDWGFAVKEPKNDLLDGNKTHMHNTRQSTDFQESELSVHH